MQEWEKINETLQSTAQKLDEAFEIISSFVGAANHKESLRNFKRATEWLENFSTKENIQ